MGTGEAAARLGAPKGTLDEETYAVTKDEKDRPPRELEKRVKRGDLGRKTGRGFYDYSADPPRPIPD